jgi:aldehyde:ferredoxin oxidoreductase
MIEGKTVEPVYVNIGEERQELRSTVHLCGLGTTETQHKLKARHGSGIRVPCISPGGEKLVRYAGIFSATNSAARGMTTVLAGNEETA